jgi:hypothetical protein
VLASFAWQAEDTHSPILKSLERRDGELERFKQIERGGESLASRTAAACAGEWLNNLAAQTGTPTAFKTNEQRGTYPDDDMSNSWRYQASSGWGERTGQ